MNISIFYEKQDQYKTIKDLTYHIGNVGVDINEKNKNMLFLLFEHIFCFYHYISCCSTIQVTLR